MSESQLDRDTEDQRQMDVGDAHIAYANYLREQIAHHRALATAWAGNRDTAAAQLAKFSAQYHRTLNMIDHLEDTLRDHTARTNT